MRPSRRPIIIATRRSRLAMAQTNAVAAALRRLHPNVTVNVLPIESRGDQLRDHPLAGVGGKGLFTGAIEAALLRERADIAVHSLKDLPVESTAGLVIAAIPARGDVRDCIVSPHGGLADLPRGATVGTSSLRRAAELCRARPDLSIAPLRGNVDTRLAAVMDRREHDAAVLAMAGLMRVGLGEHANHPVAPETCLPAAGQAALAIQCRADDHVTLRRCLPLNHAATAACVEAERAVVTALGADCRTAMGVLATIDAADRLNLRSRVLAPDGSAMIESSAESTVKSARRAINTVVVALQEQGAEGLIQADATY